MGLSGDSVVPDHGLIVAQKHGLERSNRWDIVQRAFRKANPTCAASGLTTDIQVHHVLPFHLCIIVAKRPDLELDPRNLISLSESMPASQHLRVGHLGDFRTYNPNVREDAAYFLAHPGGALPSENRPPVLAKMTPADKRAFRALVVKLYGRKPQVRV